MKEICLHFMLDGALSNADLPLVTHFGRVDLQKVKGLRSFQMIQKNTVDRGVHNRVSECIVAKHVLNKLS